MKIAITSSDGINVDKHFGHAEHFYIYELTHHNFILLEKRKTEKYCIEKGQDENTNKLEDVFNVIKDCLVVYTKMIGEKPSAFLKEKGIRTRIYTGPVNNIINYYI